MLPVELTVSCQLSVKMAAITRPNIRIEIQNNLVEAMDVDEDPIKQGSDMEDGEINEGSLKDTKVSQQSASTTRVYTNKDEGFSTGVDIFDVKESEKLQERANRFGLDPSEISNFTNEDLLKLHTSLGIINNDKDIRFEAIHLRGTEEMSTEDVFEYFGKYGPSGIEWIDDESCNVVWQDNLSAARAMHFISKAVRGMPVEGSCDPFTKDLTENPEDSRSILLVNSNREIEIAKDDDDSQNNKDNDDSVNLSDITVPIPPGYWRLGLAHPKAKFLLLRFALKTDKKPLKAERFSEYYKKYGNPNFGGLKGIISASCRNKFKGIFDRNKDIAKSLDTKNPWGDLAENWHADESFGEQIYISNTPSSEEPSKIVTSGKSEVLKRLGVKRIHSVNEIESEEKIVVKKPSKVPRMRMYADDEEVKIKRKKQLLQIKQKHQQEAPPTNDLRNVIGSKKERDRDLGVKLKNRQRKEESRNNNFTSSAEPVEINRKYSTREKRTKRAVSPKQESSSDRRTSRHSHRSKSYKNKLHSDRYEHEHNSHYDNHKPRSKVAVVIKTQKRPTVASTIWSRITPKKERLKTASERLQSRKDSSSSSDESSSASSSSSSNSSGESSDSNSDSEDDRNNDEQPPPLRRPGFSNVQANSDRKSPLRIEINNDHFKEE